RIRTASLSCANESTPNARPPTPKNPRVFGSWELALVRKDSVMPTEMMIQWGTLIALGAFHGINPGMGWLFAVALGMQEGRRGAVLRALVPLGAGHALAVAAAVGIALAIGLVIPLGWLRWPIAGVLVVLGTLRFFRHRHPRWGGMRVSMGGLTV